MMSPEPGMPMGEDGYPDTSSPEFMSQVYNMLLGVKESADKVEQMGHLIRRTSFQELTPHTWVEIHSHLKDVEDLVEFTRRSLEGADMVIDNEKAIEGVTEITRAQYDARRESP